MQFQIDRTVVCGFVRRAVRAASEGFPGFLKRRWHPNEGIDVGYLEADSDTLIDYLGHDDFCTIENLADFGPGRKNCGVVVVGVILVFLEIEQPNRKISERPSCSD